jgi:hypothetical protein
MPLIGSQVFAPEALRILAGGETTGTMFDISPSPGRAIDQTSSVALSGLGGLSATIPGGFTHRHLHMFLHLIAKGLSQPSR